MKSNVVILLFFIANFIIGQTKSSDYYIFYKGGEKYLKPVKYVLFETKKGNVKREKEGAISFEIASERFVYDENKYSIDTCSVKFLNKIKIEDIHKLSENEILFYKEEIKKTKIYKKSEFSHPFPIGNTHPYFKVIVLEIVDNKIIKYAVDWESLTF